MSSIKRILIIAGPNGAGKTTFARSYLPNEGNYKHFINADLIAEGISPFDPSLEAVRAGRLQIELMDEAVESGESFSIETTLAGRGYEGKIKHWRDMGYRITIVFLYLPSPDIAIERVKERVSHGGHNVPDQVVRRRFEKGLNNFNQIYKELAHLWVLIDNSDRNPVIMERGSNS